MPTWLKVLRVIATVLLGFLEVVFLVGLLYSNAPILFLILLLLGAFGIFAMWYFPGRKRMMPEERRQWREAKKDLQSAMTEAARLREESGKVMAEAISNASRIRAEANADVLMIRTKAQAEAKAAVEEGKAQSAAELNAAKEANRQAQKKLFEADQRADQIISEAHKAEQTIIETANSRAKEIAGSAYQAKENAEQYTKTVEAMRNVIQGYGNEYLKPTYSLLDELAENFSFADAGKKLKEAREKSARMVRLGFAAKCDYVEQNRKETAIAFVVDAFNGKVDSILSKTKKDNYGVLEQKIKDAYQLVNFNGAAFRNAAITEGYLETRLEELKWAVAVSELKARDQEEQRRIREQMREEERTRREYERAQKEAAKEEEMLRKAMAKAEAMLKTANEEKRAEFEAKLEELRGKLAEAEAKGQRALSMAQQTKHGNVYVISNIGSFGENVYKVGMTRRLDPLDRVRELGDASVPFPFDVHAIIESDDAPALETALHKELALAQMNKVNPRKEFFRVSLSAIKGIVEGKGYQASWTMRAEAADYYETLAIEKTLQEDPEARRKWEAFAAEAELTDDEDIVTA